MRGMRWMALAALTLAASACGVATRARVPVNAGPAGAAALDGEWAGEYESPELGRGGSIVFRLAAGRDTAEGDVVMVPRGSRAAYQRAPAEPGTLAPAARTSQVLTIRFVRVQGDQVNGTLDPYRDPECDCSLFTAFQGTIRGDVLSGTFTTRGLPSGQPATGTWHVERHR